MASCVKRISSSQNRPSHGSGTDTPGFRSGGGGWPDGTAREGVRKESLRWAGVALFIWLLRRHRRSRVVDRQQDHFLAGLIRVKPAGVEQHLAVPDFRKIVIDRKVPDGRFLRHHFFPQATEARDVPL